MTTARTSGPRPHRRTLRLVVMVAAGGIVASGLVVTGLAAFAVSAGWAAASLVYLVWVWVAVAPMDGEATSDHATQENPKRATTDVLIVIATLVSLVALVFVFGQASQRHGAGRDLIAGLAILSVALSWALIHTLFTLRYAVLYYTGPDGGIDFNQHEKPTYWDFAYFSFVVGMTFQVADTNIVSPRIRRTVLRHALLSYLFGVLVIATAVNLIAGLAT